MAELNCLRCGGKMEGPRREKIQLGEQGLLGSHWAHMMAGALEERVGSGLNWNVGFLAMAVTPWW